MHLDLKDRWDSYSRPFGVLRFALEYLLQSLWLGKRSDARDYAFAQFYADVGRQFAKREDESPVPRLVAQAYGITLDLGAGSGNQLPRFDADSVTRVFGLEPNENFMSILKTRLQDYPDLEKNYVVVNSALEDQATLDTYGVVEGSVDTIVCMQVLCSVSDPTAAAQRIYQLLKPGGQLLYWEHQKSSDAITRWVQRAWNPIWSPLMGGCRFNGEVEKAILDAGSWEILEFDHDRGRSDDQKDQRYSLLPHTWGRLIKREIPAKVSTQQ